MSTVVVVAAAIFHQQQLQEDHHHRRYWRLKQENEQMLEQTLNKMTLHAIADNLMC
jgi:hypothetical protein